VDLPFATISHFPGGGETSIRPLTEQPAPKPIAEYTLKLSAYPERSWSAEWRAWYGLSEYAATDWRTAIKVAPWQANQAEIDQLRLAARDERPDALGEILAQNEEFASYFMALLTVTTASCPNTFRLVSFASIVAMFTVLHFKNGTKGKNAVDAKDQYEPRPRPSQICPALLPPVPVPAHASYPSGHSTEAHLIAAVIEDVLAYKNGGTQIADVKWQQLITPLYALAARIGRNRELAGLHYESDTAAGAKLAQDILPYLKDTPEYKRGIELAAKEWS
jgi:membrane-associated phospholipid phosphatase